MSRGGSKDPFYRRLDETTCIGPGVKKILTTRLGLLPCGCMGECRGHSDVEPRVGADAASRLPKATTDHEFVWRADSEQCSVCGENHHGCIIVKQPSVSPVDEGEAPPQTFEEWWDEEIRLAQIHIGSGDYWVSKGIAEKAWNAAKVSSPAAHEWLGCEEANGWFVASCSCGWTYQHPNYGTTQDTFVNHWGDHIRAVASSSPAVAGGESETVLDAAILRVLEQRCERGTDWDKAVLACAESLRRLKRGERAEHETQPLIKDVRGNNE